MNKKILILYLPTALQRMHPSPPLGIAMLKRAVHQAGFDAAIDDIEMKYWARDRIMIQPFRGIVRMLPLRYNNPKSIFLNIRRVSLYIDCGILHNRMRKILQEWEYLLDEPASSFSHVACHHALFRKISQRKIRSCRYSGRKFLYA